MGSSGSKDAPPSNAPKKSNTQKPNAQTTANNQNTQNTQKTANNQTAQNSQRNVKGGQQAVESNNKASKQKQDTSGKGSTKDSSQKSGKQGKGNTSVQREEIHEQGWKKHLREKIRHATAGNDMEELQHMIEVFENNRMVDGGDLTDAQEKMNYLRLKKQVRDAILRRHPVILDEAIADVENSQYRGDLQGLVDKAKQVKAELAELDNYRHDVLNMEQQTISEIRSYKYPPPGVRETMIATYMVLGYEEDDVKEWQDLTALMGRYGKDSLMREVAAADNSNISDHAAIRIKKYLAQYSLDDVRAVSNGAATFYIWASDMVNRKGGGGSQGQTTSRGGKKDTTPQQKQPPQKQQQQQQQKQKEQQQKQQQQQKQKEQPKQKEQQKQQAQQKQQPPKQQQNKQQQSQKNADQKQQPTKGNTTQRTAGKV